MRFQPRFRDGSVEHRMNHPPISIYFSTRDHTRSNDHIFSSTYLKHILTTTRFGVTSAMVRNDGKVEKVERSWDGRSSAAHQQFPNKSLVVIYKAQGLVVDTIFGEYDQRWEHATCT